MTTLRRIKRTELAAIRTEILQRQGWLCPLCAIDLRTIPSRNWCLDHDHTTGALRGVLCRNCNGIEGKVHNRVIRAARSDKPKNWLSRLWHYWNLHETNQTGLLHPTYKTPKEKRAHVAKKAKARYIKNKLKKKGK